MSQIAGEPATQDFVEVRLPAAGAYLSVLRTATARPRSSFGLHPRRDRGPAHRSRRGLRDPASAGRARLGAQLCLPPRRRLSRSHRLGADHGRPRPSRDTFAWTVLSALAPARSPPPWTRTKPFRSASTNSAARDPGRREGRGRAGAGRRARYTGAARPRAARSPNEARRTADGIDGIPEQARPHPEDEISPEAVAPGDGAADRGDPRPARPSGGGEGLGKGQRAGR